MTAEWLLLFITLLWPTSTALLSSVSTGIASVGIIWCPLLVGSPLPFLLSHCFDRPCGTICVLAATCLGIRTVTFGVDELAPSIPFALLDAEFHGTVGKNAFLFPFHWAVRALRRIPVVTESGPEF